MFKQLTALPKLSCFLVLLLMLLQRPPLQAQKSTIESVPSQPAPEVYDLLKDSKGYIWLAHDLGVSRYDGASFINFSNPYQNSLAMTDLLEDKQGRIWCHNFTGQIFYIENGEMHLLEQYKYKEEKGFPRLVICGDELIATSIKGLFVYNLLTGQSRYHDIPDGTRSLAAVGNKVICHGNFKWYSYEKGQPVRQLNTDLHFDYICTPIIQNVNYKDTFFLVVNPRSTYFKLTLEGSTVKVQEAHPTNAFLNTVSVDGNRIWVHTKNNSFTTDGKEFIDGMDLSDVITDGKGYRWMSSLKKGLCMQYNAQQTEKLDVSSLEAGDHIRRMQVVDGKFFLTTTNGKLYELNSRSSLSYLLTIPKLAGIIDHITPLAPDQFLLTASVGLYLYDHKKRQLKQVDPSYNFKDVAVHNGRLYAASSIGIRYCTLEQLFTQLSPIEKSGLYNKENRCKSLAFKGDSLIAAYSDGLYIADKGVIRPLLYNQHPIYASKVRVIGNKILVGTYNQGLLIIENSTITHLTEKDGLISNNIKDIKTSNGNVWLVYHDDFQQLDPSLTHISDAALYLPKAAGINDFVVVENKLYIAASDYVYSMSISNNPLNMGVATFIDKVKANGKDLLAGQELKHFQNHLQFHVSTPFFSPHSKIIYKYRIKSATDSVWQVGAPGQSVFNVIALEPGNYTIEFVASDKSRKAISAPAVYSFTIQPPWQQTWTFRIVAAIAVIGIGLYVVRQYYNSRLRKQRVDYEKKLAVQEERQRISSEIHDDIGAGLSAIRLLTEITKNKLPNNEVQGEVSKIHASVSELSHKMREVIWSLSTENDRLESLLYYLQRQAQKLFENSPIQLKVSFPTQEIPDIEINGDKRRHIYLAVKEALHNCLKHSAAQTCHLSMEIVNHQLLITVADDGTGFIPVEKAEAGNGLRNMNRRLQQIQGQFELFSHTKTEVRFRIPLNENT